MNDINIKPNPAKQQFEFVIKRTFNAPRGRVWQAWTEADHLGKWWGPAGFDIVSVKLDLRPGGTFHYCLRSPDGQDMWGKFIFREIVPQEDGAESMRQGWTGTFDRLDDYLATA